MTFDEWKKKQGFPVTSTQEPLWRECWETAQQQLDSEIKKLKYERWYAGLAGWAKEDEDYRKVKTVVK